MTSSPRRLSGGPPSALGATWLRRATKKDAVLQPPPLASMDESEVRSAELRATTGEQSRPGHGRGQYQLQAAIAAEHDRAATFADTNGQHILDRYEELLQLVDNPIVALNRAVAVAMLRSPREGLALLDDLQGPLGGDHRLHAVKAQLAERDGDPTTARTAYETAAQLTTSLPRQRYLRARAARLADRP